MSDVRRLGDRYQVGELLGRGGMAEVHEGRDLRLGRRVAIKILRPDLARDPSFLARFRREAQSAAGLNHPNIVAVYDTGEDVLGEGPGSVIVPFIVMELVEGITLKELLTSGNRLVPERALEITSGILAALDYSHRHGIIHRDIKPANVMLTTTGLVKVMDFGIARATSDTSAGHTTASTVMGTAAYLSPEQAQGKTVDARSDLYSAGVVLFELLTRRAPFLADSAVAVAFAHVNEGPPIPSEIDPTVPRELDQLVSKALVKDPAGRYQSAAEFRADVERAIAGVPVTAMLPRQIVGASADATPTSVLSSVDPNATQAHTVIAGGAGEPFRPPIEPPRAAPTPDERKGRSGRVFGLVLIIAALAGGAIFLALNLFNANNHPKVQVPELSGLTVAQARTTLQGVNLQLGAENPKISDKPKDTIIGQNPPFGERVAEGSSVSVDVSAGKEQVEVPDLVGLSSEADARTALEDFQLKLGRVTEKDSSEPEGRVIAQSIQPNTKVDVGTAVNITVSTARVSVPSLVGRTQEQALADLSNAGFERDVVLAESTSKPGTVVAQSPVAGTKVKKGSLVTITVAVAPSPTPTPTATQEPTPSATDTSTEQNVPGLEGNPGLSAEPTP